MTHIWMRAEARANEKRTGLMPDGAAQLVAKGFQVTIEDSPDRVVPIDAYVQAGCTIAPTGSWVDAPNDAIILGLKELPEDGSPLHHRHIMFGHAFKGQASGAILLERFRKGGGTLLDLEYLVDAANRRVAAFGYWAGYAGAALSLAAFAAHPGVLGKVDTYSSADSLADTVKSALGGATPNVLIIGALGRVGSGASALCETVGATVTKWDMAETASGGPFPEILAHDVFLNCILANEGVPVFVPADAKTASRSLRVIGDIACDPDSEYNPVKVYDRATTWTAPTLRVHEAPILDVMAIDNLPSLLPKESSEDFSAQLLPHLLTLDDLDGGVWGRAAATFQRHLG